MKQFHSRFLILHSKVFNTTHTQKNSKYHQLEKEKHFCVVSSKNWCYILEVCYIPFVVYPVKKFFWKKKMTTLHAVMGNWSLMTKVDWDYKTLPKKYCSNYALCNIRSSFSVKKKNIDIYTHNVD